MTTNKPDDTAPYTEAIPGRYTPGEGATLVTTAPDDEVTAIEAPELEAPETIRTKFVVEAVTHYCQPGAAVTLKSVYGDEGENKAFWQDIPQGHIEMTITNADTASPFKPGQAFHVNFTPVAA